MPNTQLDYTDNVAFTTPGLDYMVEMELDEMCTATIWRAQDFNSSRSNKDKGQFSAGNGTGDSNNGIGESYLQEVKISPNPTNGLLQIAQPEAKALTIEIRSIDGQLLQSVGTSLMNEQIDLGTYANGVYFVTIALQKSREVYRVVKQ